MHVFHVSLSMPSGNFGDDVLFWETRNLFYNVYPEISFTTLELRKHISDGIIEYINRHADMLLIGGGGLILSGDGTPHSFQWPVTPEQIEKIEIPIVVFAIGFNEFYGDEKLDNRTKEVLQALMDHSVYFSMRNTGSIRAMEENGLRASSLHVDFYPSMTEHGIRKSYSPIRRVGINLAGDRPFKRFGSEDKLKSFISNMRDLVEMLKNDGKEVIQICHSWNPNNDLLQYTKDWPIQKIALDAVFSPYHIIQGLELYASMDLVIPMRGHAHMIPFSMGIPTIPIVTHRKIQWFLEDVGMTNYKMAPSWPAERMFKFIKKLEDHHYSLRYKELADKAIDNIMKHRAITCQKLESTIEWIKSQ